MRLPSMIITNLLSAADARRRRPPTRTRFFRPELEHLEARMLPSTAYWTGNHSTVSNGVGSGVWSDPGNWLNFQGPNPGDDIDFPAYQIAFVSSNDLAANVVYGTISFTNPYGYSGGYFLNKNAVHLRGGIFDTAGAPSYPGDVVAFDGISLDGPQTFGLESSTALLTVRSPVNLNGSTLTLDNPIPFNPNFLFAPSTAVVEGVVSGGGAIVKAGEGPWELRGSNTYAGRTFVNYGVLFASNDNALGSVAPGSDTVVSDGGSLAPIPPAGSLTSVTIPEPITLNGAGLATSPGAISLLFPNDFFPPNPNFSGPITLGSDGTIYANDRFDPGQQITLSAPLNLNAHKLTVNGNMKVVFTNTTAFNAVLKSTTQFSQLDLPKSGGLELHSSTLTVTTENFQAAVGDSFRIINSQDAITGSFQNLPDGSVTTTPDGQQFTVHYVVPGGGRLEASSQVILTRVATPSVTALAVTATVVLAGQPITFTATVTDASGPPPGGTVTFLNGSQPLARQGLAGGVATFTTSLPAGSYHVVAQFGGTGDLAASTSAPVDVLVNDPPPPAPLSLPWPPLPRSVFVSAADAGGGPDVKVFAADGTFLASFFAFDMNFTGGVRVAVGDVNGDGFPDIITAPGPGGGPNVIVFSGLDRSQIDNFFAFDMNFTGGCYVACGDVNGDGFADIIVGADAGGGPNVLILSGKDRAPLSSYFPYDIGFSGGVRVAAGDVNGDGLADIITGAGPGGGPNVTVYQLVNSRPQVLQSYFAFDQRLGAGLFVGAGDVNGDGHADVIAGTGPLSAAGTAILGGPAVAVFSGADIAPLSRFAPFGASFLGAVRVGATDRTGGGKASVIAVHGPGGNSEVDIFDGLTGQLADHFFAYNPNFTGGIYLANSGH